MPVYNKEDLLNLEIRSVALNAHQQDLITTEEKERIFQDAPVGVYSPNIFLRIGIGLLTALAVNAVLGLLFLVSGANASSVLLLLLSIGCFGLLEFASWVWKHYKSGLDDVLLHLGIIYLLVYISDIFESGGNEIQTIVAAIAFIVYSLSAIRYLNHLAAILAVLSLSFFIFSEFTLRGSHTIFLLSLSLSISIALLFQLIGWLFKITRISSYFKIFRQIRIAAAFCFYASFHIYFISEIKTEIGSGQSIIIDPVLTWFSWCWTFLVPVIYLLGGLRKKDRSWMRMGLLLLLSAFFFIHYYHPLLSFEVSAILYGSVLILVSYALIRYLRNHSENFTYEPGGDESDLLLAEPMLVAAGFAGNQGGNSQSTSNSPTRFEGGSFGGGGAGSEF
jgi:uncharacterized membrane protein YgcG